MAYAWPNFSRAQGRLEAVDLLDDERAQPHRGLHATASRAVSRRCHESADATDEHRGPRRTFNDAACLKRYEIRGGGTGGADRNDVPDSSTGRIVVPVGCDECCHLVGIGSAAPMISHKDASP